MASTGYFGYDKIGSTQSPLIWSSAKDYLDSSDDPIGTLALNNKGQIGFELVNTKTARLNFGTSRGDPVFTFPSNGGTIALTSDSPFSKISRVDSSTSVTLEVNESCVLYPITPTASIGVKFSAGPTTRYVGAGAVIQNTSYGTSIRTGTGFSREYDVGQYYSCYYGLNDSFTQSVTSKKAGIGINTFSISAPINTTVPCLACILKKSI